MANKIQLRRGTKAQLTASGPLAAGEPGYTTDTRELVIGNGAGANTPVVTATSADITYYVRTDGSDNNTGLANTAAGAFKSIQKAVDMLPKELLHVVNINIAAGTYAENIRIAGFRGSGSLTITGNESSPSTVVVSSVELFGNFGAITLAGITANTTAKDAFVINRCVGFRMNTCQVTGTALGWNAAAVYFSTGVIAYGSYNNRNIGIAALAGSQVSVASVTGTGNNTGMYATDGGVIVYLPSGTTLTGNVAFSNTGTGLITNGVLNPWGDNTLASRSFVSAGSSTDQSIAAGVNTKVLFPVLSNDNLGEYNASASRFTAKKPGLYSIDARIALAGLSVGATTISFYLYINGGFARSFGVSAASTGSPLITVRERVVLSAGQFVEIFINLTSTGSVQGGNSITFLQEA